jgi:hypothetical protein
LAKGPIQVALRTAAGYNRRVLPQNWA